MKESPKPRDVNKLWITGTFEGLVESLILDASTVNLQVLKAASMMSCIPQDHPVFDPKKQI